MHVHIALYTDKSTSNQTCQFKFTKKTLAFLERFLICYFWVRLTALHIPSQGQMAVLCSVFVVMGVSLAYFKVATNLWHCFYLYAGTVHQRPLVQVPVETLLFTTSYIWRANGRYCEDILSIIETNGKSIDEGSHTCIFIADDK